MRTVKYLGAQNGTVAAIRDTIDELIADRRLARVLPSREGISAYLGSVILRTVLIEEGAGMTRVHMYRRDSASNVARGFKFTRGSNKEFDLDSGRWRLLSEYRALQLLADLELFKN